MKKIEAIVRKTKFEDVKEALLNSDIDWFEYHSVHGIGQSREERIYRVARWLVLGLFAQVRTVIQSCVTRSSREVEGTSNTTQNK